MPRYNYVCQDHGEFVKWCSMADWADPAPCPHCGRSAARAVSVPSLALMSGATRKAHSINERSADEPKLVKRGEPGTTVGRSHSHGHGHVHHGSRPWMIGH